MDLPTIITICIPVPLLQWSPAVLWSLLRGSTAVPGPDPGAYVPEQQADRGEQHPAAADLQPGGGTHPEQRQQQGAQQETQKVVSLNY